MNHAWTVAYGIPKIANLVIVFSYSYYLVRSILDAVLKQGVLRLFQHGLVRLGTPVLDEENIAVLK